MTPKAETDLEKSAKIIPSKDKRKEKAKTTKIEPKRRDKTDLGEDFVAPDGGWAWIVCIAAGVSSFCGFTPVQQYGIIYRQRMYDLGFDAKQITTIINSELATAALTGIVNGALFRRFTFRQAAITGGVLIFLGVFLTAFCTTFLQYFLCFSCLYGIGLGMNQSSLSIAINTYFKEHRRRAVGFSSTITGLGPIVLPHICTFLLLSYGTQGTILLVAAFSLNVIVCGITLQPVKWHVTKKKVEVELKDKAENFEEVTLVAQKDLKTQENSTLSNECKQSEEIPKEPIESRSKDERPESAWAGTCAEKTELLRVQQTKGSYVTKVNNSDEDIERKLTFKQKVIKFFDLDLLTDITFLNLIQGMTVMMFCELNFSFLTPFILGSYGYKNEQIALAMSLLAGVDIVVRFTAPFLLEKAQLSNRFLFAFGIVVLLIGRICVTIVDSYAMILGVFLFMGFGKGFRSIFAPLIIPTYIPLHRLPAASGLQLFLNALFTTAVGPLLGLIADISSYTFTIHLMNLITSLSLLLWIIEWIVRRSLKKEVP